MELSLGFIAIIILVLFPGLIFRRLYFYGEFSKEFKSNHNLFSLLAISTIPGIVNLFIIYILYDTFFESIDIGEIIDVFKNINNDDFRFTNSTSTPIKELIYSKASPFLSYLYLNSFLFGSISGRLIRLSRLDTKFKLLRFKNYWFYMFNGQHTSFKKMKHLKLANKKHLFTKADILIDSNHKTHLYSGIVVDYELSETDCNTLTKVMLQNAKRYSTKDNKTVSVDIAGNLLIVDCSTMKNINLTYAYEEAKSILKSKLPNIIEVTFGLLIILLIPSFIFKLTFLEFDLYDKYYELSWYKKIFSFLLTIQVFSLLNPFEKSNEEYRYVTWKGIGAKIFWISIFLSLIII